MVPEQPSFHQLLEAIIEKNNQRLLSSLKRLRGFPTNSSSHSHTHHSSEMVVVCNIPIIANACSLRRCVRAFQSASRGKWRVAHVVSVMLTMLTSCKEWGKELLMLGYDKLAEEKFVLRSQRRIIEVWKYAKTEKTARAIPDHMRLP